MAKRDGGARGSGTRDGKAWLRACALLARAVCGLVLATLATHTFVVGVVQGGVGSPVPWFVSSERLAQLVEGLPWEEACYVDACYGTPNASGVRPFSADPELLRRSSRLGCAFSCLASEADPDVPQAVAERELLEGEYAALGLDLSFARRHYLRQCGDRLAAWAALFVLACVVAHRLDDADAGALQAAQTDDGAPPAPRAALPQTTCTCLESSLIART